MVKSCCAYGCTNEWTPNGEITFHKFPFKRPEILKLWLVAIRRKNWTPSKGSRLCSTHFTDSDYLFRPGSCRRLLKLDAVPSIFNYPRHFGSPLKIIASGREYFLLKDLNELYRTCSQHFEVNSLQNHFQPTAIPTIFPNQEGSSRLEPMKVNYTTNKEISLNSPGASYESTRGKYDNICILYNYLTKGTRQDVIGGESTSEIHQQCSTPKSVPPQNIIHTVQMPQVFSSESPEKEKIKKTIKQLRHQNAVLQKKKEQFENQKKNLLLVLKLSPLQNLKHA